MGLGERLVLIRVLPALAAVVLGAGCRGCTGIDDYALDGAAGGTGIVSGPGVGGSGPGTGQGGAGAGSSTQSTGGGAAGPQSSSSSGSSGGCGPCYSGPPGTEGVGLCQGGEQCGDGACEGEVVPVADDCVTSDREDCEVGAGAACSGAIGWHGIITENADFFFSFRQPIAAAPDGRAIGLGGYLSATFFDGSALTDASSSMVMFGLGAQQAVAWKIQRGIGDGQSRSPIEVATAGDPFAVALQRYDGMNSFLDVERWSWGELAPRSTRPFRNVSGFFSFGLAVDATRTYVALNHDGTADLDGDGSADGGSSPIQKGFLAALDAEGATAWSKPVDIAGDVAFHAISLAPDGLWFSGMTKASLDLGCPAPVSADSAFIGRLDAATGDCELLLGVGALGAGFDNLEFTRSYLVATADQIFAYFPSDQLLVARTHALDLSWSVPLQDPLVVAALTADGFGHPVVAGNTNATPAAAWARKFDRADGASVWPADLVQPGTETTLFGGAAGLPDGSTLLGGSFYGAVTIQGIDHATGPGGSASTMFLRAGP